MRAKIAVCRADDTLQPRESQLLSQRQRLQCGLDFQAQADEQVTRQTLAVASFSLLSRHELSARAHLGCRGTAVAEIPRAVRPRGPCVPSDCNGKTQVPEHRGDSTESGSYSRGASVWCVLTTGCYGVTRLGLNTPNAQHEANQANSANS